MRFNKSEVSALALGQPSHKFEKEGVLFVREKQEGFFRRTEKSSSPAAQSKNVEKAKKGLLACYGGRQPSNGVSVERWCRLRGNLLFYFKSRDHWSEPAGVIVVEDCEVKPDLGCLEATFGLILAFNGGAHLQHLGTYTEAERDAWMAALRSASHRHMRTHLEELKARLNAKMGLEAGNDSISVIDPSEAPLCEMSISCDNLLCDALGRSPSAKIVISVRSNDGIGIWSKLGQTEIAEKSSNPAFMRTIGFPRSMSDKANVKIEAYDMRERLTSTRTLLGTALTTLSELLKSSGEEGKLRLKLESPNNPDGRTAGFVSLSCWLFEAKVPASTDSTPVHKPLSALRNGHKRSLSLPPAVKHRARAPDHGQLGLLFSNPIVRSYKFHSGLAGDIVVQEVMAEPKLAFAFPQQLLSLWICEEKELVHEIAGLGELRSPWHECQMTWLENHLDIINTYTQALESLDSYKGPDFRKSADKEKKDFEFVPVNMHLQRQWAENDSLRKSGIFDIVTHGAFTSLPTAKNCPGLIKMLKELKAPQVESKAWCSQSDRLQMAEDTLTAVRRVRREVVDSMRMLMKAAKDKQPGGMFGLIEDMLRKTKCLCSLLDQHLVEEIFAFLEDNRIPAPPPEKDEFAQSVAEFMQRNRLKIDLRPRLLHHGLGPNLQTPCTEFVAKELRTPEVDLIFPPVMLSSCGGGGGHASNVHDNGQEIWRTYSAYTSGYQSVDRLSDIDEFEESFRYLSVVDKTKHYYTLCRAASPLDTPPSTPKLTLDEGAEMEYEDEFSQADPEPAQAIMDEEVPADDVEDVRADIKNDANNDQECIATDSGSGLHYKAGDEPEPIDLTHLNVEAAMMCLASKVRMLCGKANSPTLSSRTFRFKELDHSSKKDFKIPDVPRPQDSEGEIEDWTAELRPSMRKLRQGMDSLCKTAKLTCSVLRLRQTAEAVSLSHAIKYRRDVCFSQALTTLVTGLMAKLWCSNETDAAAFLKVCISLGPLAAFESLLSHYGGEVTMFNDMIVVVEDLRNVEFNLILVDDKRKACKPKAKKAVAGQKASPSSSGVPTLEYYSFPLPRITGSRSSLKVLLPVPDYVYTMLPLEQMKTMTFTVTPIFFNVGINEKATLAGKTGNNGPQEKNNIDNFKTLAEYYRRYKKIAGLVHQGQNRRFSGCVAPNEPHVDDLLAILKDAVHCKKSKNVDILHLASQICRRLQGLRFTNCKSGKDRTGMAATLEQIQILSREFDLAEHEYQKALDAMRSEGTRLANCEKNIGTGKYAFHTLQLATFPYQYRAPIGSFQASLQG